MHLSINHLDKVAINVTKTNARIYEVYFVEINSTEFKNSMVNNRIINSRLKIYRINEISMLLVKKTLGMY